MTNKTTRDAALSRLFGTEGQPEGQETVDTAGEKELSNEQTRVLATREDNQSAREPGNTESHKKGGGPGEEDEANSSDPNEPHEEEAKEVRSGYIGLGRYAREDGILERITPYVRPDQAEALRIAVARKRDPRGRDISRIIQALLDEAGYCDPGEEEQGGGQTA